MQDASVINEAQHETKHDFLQHETKHDLTNHVLNAIFLISNDPTTEK